MAIKKELFINILFLIIPISYVAGNLLLNLNILLIIIISIFSFGLKIFKEKITEIDKVLLVLFLFIIINGIVNDFLRYDNSNIIFLKSLGYLRYIILYFIIKFLIQKNIINFKYLFFSFGATCAFVAFDIIVQFIFNKDLFGYEATKAQRVLSGPFGDEYIAGSFIQRFYIFLLYFLLLFGNFKKNQTKSLLIYFAIALTLLGCLLAGNRIPFMLFVLSLTLFCIFEKKFRKQFLTIFIISFLLISFNITFNESVKKHFSHFVGRSVEMKDYFLKRYTADKFNYIPNTYAKEIETGLQVWENNKLFGGGIRSFYFNCSELESPIFEKHGGTNCNAHPHNYYLHIATELGLFGLFLFFITFLIVTLKSLKIIFFSNKNINKSLLLPFFLAFVMEIFPFKTTGSFFTSSNSIFLFIIISFIIGLAELKKEYKL